MPSVHTVYPQPANHTSPMRQGQLLVPENTVAAPDGEIPSAGRIDVSEPYPAYSPSPAMPQAVQTNSSLNSENIQTGIAPVGMQSGYPSFPTARQPIFAQSSDVDELLVAPLPADIQMPPQPEDDNWLAQPFPPFPALPVQPPAIEMPVATQPEGDAQSDVPVLARELIAPGSLQNPDQALPAPPIFPTVNASRPIVRNVPVEQTIPESSAITREKERSAAISGITICVDEHPETPPASTLPIRIEPSRAAVTEPKMRIVQAQAGSAIEVKSPNKKGTSSMKPWIALAMAAVAVGVLANLPSLPSSSAGAAPPPVWNTPSLEEMKVQGVDGQQAKAPEDGSGKTAEVKPAEDTSKADDAAKPEEDKEAQDNKQAPVVPVGNAASNENVSLGEYNLKLDGYGKGTVKVALKGFDASKGGIIVTFVSYDNVGQELEQIPVVVDDKGECSIAFEALTPKGKKESDIAAVVISNVAGADTGQTFEEAQRKLGALRATFDARQVTPEREEIEAKTKDVESEVVMGDTRQGDGGGYQWVSTHTWDDSEANSDGSLSRWKPGYSKDGGKYFIAHDYGPYGPAIMGLSAGDKVTVDGIEYTIIGYFDIARTGTAEEVRELLGSKVTCFQTCNGCYYRVAYGKESSAS